MMDSIQNLYSDSLKGFYIKGVSSFIPDDAIPVSQEEHRAAVDARQMGGTLSVVDGELRITKLVVDTADELLSAKQRKTLEIDKQAETYLYSLTKSSPAFEKQTWAAQLAEAKAFVLDSSAMTPILSVIAEKRSITVLELANKVISKDATYSAVVSSVIGQRKKMLEEVELVTNLNKLNKLKITYL